MPAINGRDRRDIEPLGGGDNGRVHRPKREIPIAPHELGDPKPIARLHRLHEERTGREVPKEPHLGLGAKPRRDEVGDLRDHQGWHDERAGMVLEQLAAGVVVTVIGVQVGVEGPGIDDEGGQANSWRRISSIRSETSL